jgi:hypothetical protein
MLSLKKKPQAKHVYWTCQPLFVPFQRKQLFADTATTRQKKCSAKNEQDFPASAGRKRKPSVASLLLANSLSDCNCGSFQPLHQHSLAWMRKRERETSRTEPNRRVNAVGRRRAICDPAAGGCSALHCVYRGGGRSGSWFFFTRRIDCDS